MKTSRTKLSFAIGAALAVSVLSGFVWKAKSNVHSPAVISSYSSPSKKMKSFASDKELARYFRELADGRKQLVARRAPVAAPSSLAQSTAVPSDKKAAAKPDISGSDESVTNVQHAGVDEGDIVKLHGEFLVILRRGRLFSVRIGERELRPISVINAFGPGIDPEGTWYDEMLISDNKIAIIGYSYNYEGTEVGLFEIDSNGRLSYKSTYHLRSDDYYSSRNYASRLIGDKLIFYTPLYISVDSDDPFETFPAVRRWHKGANENEFNRIISARRVYKAERSLGDSDELALHTVTVCDLAQADMKCKATAVLGPPGRVFYVSPESVYVWVSDWNQDGDRKSSSMLYRMPLDGGAPTAIGVSGSPVDQFSFLETEDGQLNVLVRSEAAGDGMWDAEVGSGDLALLCLARTSFADGSGDAARSSYQELPRVDDDTFQNRFIGDYLLYGTGNGWESTTGKRQSDLHVVAWKYAAITTLSVPHSIDRIEAIGNDAMIVGTKGDDLLFSGIRLGSSPSIADTYTRKGASQGELRSHGFFYKPNGPDSGTLGLPISTPARPGYEHLFEDSASILFLRNDSLSLKDVGELDAKPDGSVDDNCRASCVDWYGNARPLFARGRVFALLGYELVEGTISSNGIREKQRVNFAPRVMKAAR